MIAQHRMMAWYPDKYCLGIPPSGSALGSRLCVHKQRHMPLAVRFYIIPIKLFTNQIEESLIRRPEIIVHLLDNL